MLSPNTMNNGTSIFSHKGSHMSKITQTLRHKVGFRGLTTSVVNGEQEGQYKSNPMSLYNNLDHICLTK
jgi:hypothetical protein